MALEGQHGIVAHHAAAIIGDLDKLLAAGFDVHANAPCARIQRVLQQLLHHRGRPLHDLARGDFVGYVFGENVDAAHKGSFEFSVSSFKSCVDDSCELQSRRAYLGRPDGWGTTLNASASNKNPLCPRFTSCRWTLTWVQRHSPTLAKRWRTWGTSRRRGAQPSMPVLPPKTRCAPGSRPAVGR